jgi:hypothetical protein
VFTHDGAHASAIRFVFRDLRDAFRWESPRFFDRRKKDRLLTSFRATFANDAMRSLIGDSLREQIFVSRIPAD